MESTGLWHKLQGEGGEHTPSNFSIELIQRELCEFFQGRRQLGEEREVYIMTGVTGYRTLRYMFKIKNTVKRLKGFSNKQQ